MTEASVSSAFMKKLRERLPEAQVFKRNDLGLKGIPDCEITWLKTTLFIEFKLIDAPSGEFYLEAVKKRVAQAPVQLATCKALARAGYCFYLCWFRGAKFCMFYDPITEAVVSLPGDTNQATSWVENWFLSHRP